MACHQAVICTSRDSPLALAELKGINGATSDATAALCQSIQRRHSRRFATERVQGFPGDNLGESKLVRQWRSALGYAENLSGFIIRPKYAARQVALVRVLSERGKRINSRLLMTNDISQRKASSFLNWCHLVGRKMSEMVIDMT